MASASPRASTEATWTTQPACGPLPLVAVGVDALASGLGGDEDDDAVRTAPADPGWLEGRSAARFDSTRGRSEGAGLVEGAAAGTGGAGGPLRPGFESARAELAAASGRPPAVRSLAGVGGFALVGSEPGATVGGTTGLAGSSWESARAIGAERGSVFASTTRSRWTPRPTSTPHRKITTDNKVAAMNTKTSCLPFSWIS